MNAVEAANKNGNPWDELKSELENRYDQAKRELEEIGMMLEQSRVEVNRLAQRNASASSRLQQVQAQIDSLPRMDIQSAYDSALESQQRLFVMRGQMEKLESDKARLDAYAGILDKVLTRLEGGVPHEMRGRGPLATVETVEMMIQAQETERQRLSRQMHDGPAQALSNFILQTEIATRLFEMDQERAREELATLKSAATGTFQKVRDFIFELRPMMLDDLGLAPTIKRYIENYKDQAEIDISISTTGAERRLESYIEVMIFRAFQEFFNNALRHSQASQVDVHLDMGEQNVRVVVEDNGKGFDTSAVESGGNMSINMIRERAEMLGGYLEIDSIPGQGTRVTFQIPAGEPS
jgi:two-component system sensor histidine kinase DegS